MMHTRRSTENSMSRRYEVLVVEDEVLIRMDLVLATQHSKHHRRRRQLLFLSGIRKSEWSSQMSRCRERWMGGNWPATSQIMASDNHRDRF
jgi:hypothetical protein